VLEGKIAQIGALAERESMKALRPSPEGSWRLRATDHFLSRLKDERKWIADLVRLDQDLERETRND
jgi:hypothetical protein